MSRVFSPLLRILGRHSQARPVNRFTVFLTLTDRYEKNNYRKTYENCIYVYAHHPHLRNASL